MKPPRETLHDAAERIREQWDAAGREVVGGDSPPADFAEPERPVDVAALQAEHDRACVSAKMEREELLEAEREL